MQQSDYSDPMKLNTDEDRVLAQPAPHAPPTILEAIVKKLAVAATYNGSEIVLAPHVLYTKHAQLYVDGVVIERDGKPPKEAKVGAYKLAGLSPLRITARRFTPSPLFDANAEKYAGETLLAV
jgi:hypothetical protein